MMRYKKIIIAFIVVVLIATVFIQLSHVSIRLKTIAVLINLLIPKGDWRPLEIFTKKPIREEHSIESSGGRKLTVHIYRSKKSHSGMVIYTPFIGGGLDDPRLVNLASTFARAGFTVTVPWREEDKLIISTKDIDDIISTVLFLKMDQVGLFGISYGNGPVIIASVDPRIKDFVAFVVSFSGYYNLQDTLEFVNSPDAHPYVKEILSKTLEYYNTDEIAFLKKALSPSSVIDQIKADFFITHSTDDRYIPYTESIKLAEALKNKVPVTFALTKVFEHGVYKKFNFENFRCYYLPSFKDFYNFLYKLISKYDS